MKKLFNCHCGNRFSLELEEDEHPEDREIECDSCGETHRIQICSGCENLLSHKYEDEGCPVCSSPVNGGRKGCLLSILGLISFAAASGFMIHVARSGAHWI